MDDKILERRIDTALERFLADPTKKAWYAYTLLIESRSMDQVARMEAKIQ